MQVYSLMQDKQGYIWLATAQGACKFDGRRFQCLTTADGLADNTILDIVQDPETEHIWFLSENGESSYLDKQLKSIQAAETDLFGNSSLKQGDVVINFLRNRDQNKAYEEFTAADGSPIISHKVSCSYTETESAKSLSRSSSNAEGILWLGTWGGGAYQIDNSGADSIRYKNFLAGRIITSIIQDREKNYWFATLDEGVYVLRNPNALSFTTKQGLPHNDIRSIALDQARKTLWIGDSKGHIASLRLDRPLEGFSWRDVTSLTNTYDRVEDIYLDERGNIWLGMDEGAKIINPQGEELLLSLRATKSIHPSGKNRYWLGAYERPFELDVYLGSPVQELPITQVNCLYADTLSSEIWIGTSQGLYSYSPTDSIEFWGRKQDLLSKSITAIDKDEEGRLWIGTDGDGLLLKSGSQLLQISRENGLCSNLCHQLFIDKENQAWLCTDKGLSRISIQDINPSTLEVRCYSFVDGLAADHVNDVWVSGDSIWAATRGGLSLLRQSELQLNEQPPLTYIEQVKIWNRDTAILEEYKLNHDENNIEIHFVGLSFSSGKRGSFQYRMEGVDTAWVRTQQNSVRYPVLPSGAYIFRLRAVDRNGLSSKQEARLRFHVAKPFWRTWWFRSLLGLMVLFTLIGGSYLIIQYFKNRNELQRRLVESQQMALRTQMNPHFIFNALNAIQYFITENDKRSANSYLSTFATLMRKVLDHSSQEQISLEEEIEYLSLYLEIESLRFKGKFDYRIHSSPNMELDEIYIPPMLIQPYVENAIQHGLLQKPIAEGPRQLNIRFYQDAPSSEESDDQKKSRSDETISSVLHCIIEDNGIGRTKAMAANTRKHKGIGTTNPKERLAILNRLNKTARIDVETIDLLSDEDQSPLGTRVKISIPTFQEHVN